MDKIIENQHYMRREGKGKIPHPKKKHHIFRNLMLVLLVLVLAAGAAFAYIYSNVQKSLKQTYVNTGSNSSTIVASKPLTIILMGVDTGDTTRGGAGSWDGNSDSQIVMTLNPKTNTTTMVSMERDTMTNIEDGQGNIKSTQKNECGLSSWL
ncbi:LCP family glycopolymer transferase [Lactococcus fujiensis]|uniref:LCP family glycopolymer transferase n=1 Tax=Lactococcus fujiensis TaxID=610251 RepID=UPI000AC44298|nr:LCP family protein [Lactococcus fujiensis]